MDVQPQKQSVSVSFPGEKENLDFSWDPVLNAIAESTGKLQPR